MDESTSWGEAPTGTVSGQRIGSYRVLQSLGSGGMSSVFRAVHEETGHEVALKVLTRTLARNSTLLQRFLREARSAETLEHQNIVTIYDRGIDRGRHYLVLEYVAGGDFHEYIQRRGPLSTAEAIGVIKSVASGLRYAASRGLIHRDIKPSNILRTPSGAVKIIDLGLALQNAFEDERVTREGTTVGTVDYMAPEQARDSRATSIKSDMYSLGCTFYYFLTGVPAYPGGDITDKLTRHARSPVPEICDLRPDVPRTVSSIMQRMMAKKADDRFASYDDLIAALDAASTDGYDDGQVISLVPLADELPENQPALAIGSQPNPERGDYSINGPDSDPGSLPVVSLAELAGERSEETRTRPAPRSPAAEPAPPLARHGLEDGDPLETDSAEIDELTSIAPSQAASSASVWVVAISFIGVAVVLLAIGVVQFIDSPSQPPQGLATPIEANVDLDRPGSISSSPRIAAVAAPSSPSNQGGRVRPEKPVAPSDKKVEWVEPPDTEPVRDPGATQADGLSGAGFLPDWARLPVPDRIDGNFVVVRRVAESSDASIVPALGIALDQRIGGTIEIADEGPLFDDDFRIAGDTRLIRARPGYRPIIRIERSSSETVRKRPAVFVLDRQTLILDGIDLVVDVREVRPEQTALFSCAASTLTLKNCSITILNRTNAPFSVFRVEPTGLHPSHVRLERTLVRGAFGAGVDLAGGSTELVLNKSVVVGGPGPLVRVNRAPSALETRCFVVDSILAGPGPIIQVSRQETGGQTKPLSIRAFGSIFGRLHGVGVASVIASSSSSEEAAKQVEWQGDNNLFAGWKGFFAWGSDPLITVPGLREVRSTWNGADQESQEYPSPWPYPPDLAAVTADDLKPFLPNREKILWQVARPRPGLFEKAVGAFPRPSIPQPVGWAFERSVPSGRAVPTRRMVAATQAVASESTRALVTAPSPSATAPVSDPLDLVFDTAAPPWEGDLGSFLRDRLTTGVRHARVRVVGSGQHRFTPLRLPQHLWLELRVEPLATAEPPSWSPEPNATGPALIEIQGGALVLSNVILRHNETSRLEHLISVENGHLVLSRCQFTAPGTSPEFGGDLIAFRSLSTQPYPVDPTRPVFASEVDRPVCRLHESLLITGGVAVKVELGKGMVVLTECAIAAGITGIELLPSKVSRQRFEADLVVDHCTLTSERSIVRMGPWLGLPPGPDRPWLITSRNCAFLAMYDRKARETVLLRADAGALSRGAVSWQGSDDAADVDCFTAAGEGAPLPNRPRDLQLQWVHLWGPSHMNGRMTGPRESRGGPSVKFWEKLRPGRVEPIDLLLNPDYHPDRERLNVGADLGWLENTPRLNRNGRQRN
jgi:eukaryotic-like serine/threonine-protein kinase